MITAGVDLATTPARTACCIVEWGPSPRVVRLDTGVDRNEVVRTALAVDRTAIDAPFGWPLPFVEFARAHEVRGPLPKGELQLRTTDLFVKEVTGIRPLAVSANLIGATAMTCAQILATIEQRRERHVDRRGTESVLEAYPAAALKLWGYPHFGYKGKRDKPALRELARRVVSDAGLQLSSPQLELLATNDDAFDALVCALVARAASLGNTRLPCDSATAAAAATEGWIHLPIANKSLLGCIRENQIQS